MAKGFMGRFADGARRLFRMGRGDDNPVLGQVLRSNFAGLPQGGRWGRYVHAEWLGPYTPDLVENWILKLMRKDPQLRLGLQAIRSPFFGISYACDENTGTPETRAFVKKAFLDAPIFLPLLKSVMNSFDFGFQTHEVLWGLDDITFDEDGPGGVPAMTFAKANLIRGFVDVDPERVLIKVNDLGELVSILVDGQVEIPFAKLVHAVHDGEWQNWFGDSLLRPAYNPWYWCNFLYLYLMRYGETRLIPPIVGYAPFRIGQNEDEARTGQPARTALDVLMEQAAELRNGSVAGLPSEVDPETKQQKFRLDVIRDEGRIEQFILAINHQQALKLRALCIPERAFTQDTETGSFAMVKEHVDAFLMSLESYKDHTILPALNRVASLLVRANFKKAPAPLIKGSELARQKHALMFDLVSKALNVPLTLDDGKMWTPAMTIDFAKCFESFNTPTKRPSDVALEPETFFKVLGKPQPPAGGGSANDSGGSDGPPSGGSPAPSGGPSASAATPIDVAAVVRSELDKSLASFRRETAQALSHVATVVAASSRPASSSSSEVLARVQEVAATSAKVLERVEELAEDQAPHAAAAPAPVSVNITNNVPPTKIEAPIQHTSHVTVAEGAVRVENNQGDVVVPERSVSVTTPPVNVDVKAEIRGGDKKIVRGPDGRITDIKTAETGGP